ncbi:hypothetical protein H9P43_001298 [Blastocladiella emersonii ATCC 22665]|nr:hypothetical protein H9P43_001298 [Blastocladiella emersonii ATCC 22665]
MYRSALRRLATSSRPAALRRGGDHGHGHSAAPINPAEYTSSDYTSPFWRNVFLGSVGAFVLWNANEYYVATKDPEAIHPITAYISYHMTEEKEWKKINYTAIKEIEAGAADTLMLQELPAGRKVARVVAPMLLERGSPFGISAGTQADISDVVLKR